MSVHSSEELLTTIVAEVRRLTVRARYTTTSKEESLHLLRLARSGYEYLMVMIASCNVYPRMIGTSYAELRSFDVATQPERIKTAQELYNELWTMDSFEGE